MARLLGRGVPPSRLVELARQSGMELRGNPEAPAAAVLLLTAADDPLRIANVTAGTLPETSIVEGLRAENVRLVAAEPQETELSVVDLLRRRGVTTVDNIDTAQGQIAAVLALAGAEGQFGATPGATRAIPPVMVPVTAP